MSDWYQVGKVCVDAGLIWLGDPCYVLPDNTSLNPGANWEEFCNKLGEAKTKEWDNGIGVTVESGYGDGEYPVYVQYDSYGRVKAVKIEFTE